MNERTQYLLMGAIDGELSADDRREFDAMLEADEALRDEWQRLRAVKDLTDSMEFRIPSDAIWEGYMDSVYQRLERGIAWILVSLGATVLLSKGLWELGKAIFLDATMPLYIKGSVLALVIGSAILIVSVTREKIFMHKRDPYKDILR